MTFFSCFTFGIGSGASTELVEGLATAGKGSAEFIKEGERLQPKVSHISTSENVYRTRIWESLVFINLITLNKSA